MIIPTQDINETLLLHGAISRPTWFAAHEHLVEPILFGDPARRALYYAATHDPRLDDLLPHVHPTELVHEYHEAMAMKCFADQRITQALRDLRHEQDRADLIDDIRAAVAPSNGPRDIIRALREIADAHERRLAPSDGRMECAA